MAEPGHHVARAAEDELVRALAHDEFELWFQPSASIASGRVKVLEALARWRHPDEGVLPPSRFLPSIEGSAYALPFTRRVLELALRSARAWAAAGHPCAVAVNVSADLVGPSLVDVVTDLLRGLGVPAHHLVLEVTESAVMADPATAMRSLERLARAGIGGVAIDDFGTGHSSLGRLRDLRIDALKIDRSFVAEIDRGVDPAFVRSIIDLGHHLGLCVVAEGVEDEETWCALARLGCDAGQGFWLSRPLPAAEVLPWLAEHDAPGLARAGAVGERRRGAGRRATDRVTAAFDRAAEPMVMADAGRRWVAVNAAARALLRMRPAEHAGRPSNNGHHGDGDLRALLRALAGAGASAGVCDVTLGDGTRQRLGYELRRSVVAEHDVWVLAEP